MTLRIAAFGTDLTRRGPGLLLRDILSGKDAQVGAVVSVIAEVRPDVILLMGMDHDHGLVALAALESRLAEAGAPYPYRLALPGNAGLRAQADLDGDGRAGGRGDTQGFGRFAGEGGMAVLSSLPIETSEVRDFSGLLWRDLPGALLPDPPLPTEALAVQRLSSRSHWEVPLITPGGGRLRLLAWHAGPPVFGRGDRNARRNHDETALWLRLLDGALAQPPPAPPFVILGNANMDPLDSAGNPAALHRLLGHPAVQDPAPRSAGGVAAARDQGGANTRHRGDPALDTADHRDHTEPRRGPPPGNLRVTYVLPSAGLQVRDAGVFWPAPGTPMADTAAATGRHRLVWVDLAMP